MKKWGGLLLSMFIITLLFLIPSVSHLFKSVTNKKENTERPRIVLAQGAEKDGKEDTYSIALLKQMREKVDAWLKSLNEKIEREDITRLEVRFYEFLRDLLEWVKEKIDAKIDSSDEEKPEKGEKEGLFRETRQRDSLLFETG